jgi:hypothetical protein
MRPLVTEPMGREERDPKTIRKWARSSRNLVNYKHKENAYKRQHRIRNYFFYIDGLGSLASSHSKLI